MRDYNFFSPFLEKKKVGFDSPKVIYGAVFLLVAVFAWNAFTIYRMNAAIETMTAQISEKKNMENLKKFEETKRQLDVLDKYFVGISKIDGVLAPQAIIGSSYLASLNSAMPQNIFLQSMKVDASGIELQGISSSRTAVAEYEYNLKKLDLFEEVFVSNINAAQTGGSNFIFGIKCLTKGGSKS